MNYSILDQNVLGSLSEAGQRAYMWARERLEGDRLGYAAERFAREVDLLTEFLEPFLKDACPSLLKYILDRHSAYRFKGEKRSWTNAPMIAGALV